MKKIIFVVLLMLLPILFVFSQNIEKITFMDIGADGTKRITRSVNARFIAYMQRQVVQEGNLMAEYDSYYYFLTNDNWTDWKLTKRRPMKMTLNQEFETLLREYTLTPNAGAILQINDEYNALQMIAVPNGKNSPIWWNTDGKSYFLYFKIYLIAN